MKPGEIYLGYADHLWKQGWRPEVEIIAVGLQGPIGESMVEWVHYKHLNCGVPNEVCSLEMSKFDKSYELKETK